MFRLCRQIGVVYTLRLSEVALNALDRRVMVIEGRWALFMRIGRSHLLIPTNQVISPHLPLDDETDNYTGRCNGFSKNTVASPIT